MNNKIILSFNPAETTAECIKLINSEYRKAKWKRSTKFKIPDAHDAESKADVRIFTDGEEFVTTVHNEWYMFICPDLNLSNMRSLIDEINKVAKKVITHDYGQIYLNPYTKDLWIVAGDGGISYTEKPIKEAIRDFEEGEYDEENFEVKFENFIPEINSTVVEAEYFPVDEEGMLGDWIPVGKTIDICDYAY